jgi:hypothetical protein
MIAAGVLCRWYRLFRWLKIRRGADTPPNLVRLQALILG